MNFKGYIYLNLGHPMVCWETYRGILISADAVEEIETKHPSLWLSSKIRKENNIALANELLIESVRVKHFPEKVSRLRGLYVFRDLDSAQNAQDWPGYFVFDNLVEAEISTDNDSTRLDANWITYSDRDSNGFINESYIDNLKKYWAGKEYNDNPCWEYIINGRAIIFGTKVRKRAYERIKEYMPETLGLLELSRVAALINSDLGHIIPWIQRVSEDTYHLKHLINFKDATNLDFLERLKKFDGPKNTQDLNERVDALRLPDLRKLDCIFKISTSKLYGYNSMKVHLSPE